METVSEALAARFLALLEVHVSQLTVRGRKATGLCPFHDDRKPSFSADLEKLVWYCFPCARGGGVKDLALALGEPWGTARINIYERARFAVQSRRREVTNKARAILSRRKDERDDLLWAAWREANEAAFVAANFLGFFFRHPNRAVEFWRLDKAAEAEYADAIWQKMLIEQRHAGEGSRG